jgi:hypothetical protein
MYSKCMVAPLISTPMAMIASKAFLGLGEVVVLLERSVVEEERRSVALMPSPVLLAWTWEAA